MMIDPAIATLVGMAVVQGGGVLFWGGLMTARIRQLEKDVRPIATLREDMATMTERMERLIKLLEPGATSRGRRTRSED